MTISWLVEFVGLAAIYASLVTFTIFIIAQRNRWINSWRSAPFLLATLFFVFLTQHPFPVPDQLACPVPSAAPQLTLFKFRDAAASLYQNDAGLIRWLSNKTIVATLMNFVLCVIIGATLVRHVTKTWIALTFGATLTTSIELTQLTGLWGIYPCAYRQFNVDDLLLNTLGVMAGFITIQNLTKKKPI